MNSATVTFEKKGGWEGHLQAYSRVLSSRMEREGDKLRRRWTKAMLYCDEVEHCAGPTVSGGAAAAVAGLQSIADRVVDGYRLRPGEKHCDSVEAMQPDSWRW